METLIERAQHGDRAALRTLLLEHRGLVEGVVARFLWDRAARDDVVQNVLINIVKAIDRFGGACRFGTWVYRIAVNECLEANRRHAREGSRIDGSQARMDLFVAPDAPDGLRETARQEIRSAVSQTAERLPDGMRRAFELFYGRQNTGAEAARKLGISEQAFFVRLSAARRKVKEELQRRGIVPC